MEQQTNGYDRVRVEAYVTDIEEQEQKRLRVHMAYMADCRAIASAEAELYREAKENGIPKTPLQTLMKERKLERKIAALKTDLDKDDQEALEQLKSALGGLPLGDWALEAKPAKKPKQVVPGVVEGVVKRGRGRPKKVVDPTTAQADINAASAQANTERLHGGIKKLDIEHDAPGFDERHDDRPSFLQRVHAEPEPEVNNVAGEISGDFDPA